MSRSVAKARVKTRIPTTTLAGIAESKYVRDVVKILKTSRLNAYYPNVRLLASHIGCMAPELHRSLCAGSQVDSRSGLPT